MGSICASVPRFPPSSLRLQACDCCSCFLCFVVSVHQRTLTLCSPPTIQHGNVCDFDFNNLLHASTSVPTAAACQEKCVHLDRCSNFAFYTLDTRPSTTLCVLLRSCEHWTSCQSIENCVSAISGPNTPSVLDVCGSDLQGKGCKGAEVLSQHYQISQPKQCQALCEANESCRFFTQAGADLCILHPSCNSTKPCSSCISGPAGPGWDEGMTYRPPDSSVGRLDPKFEHP